MTRPSDAALARLHPGGSDGLWLFLYGSLLWDRTFETDREVPARARLRRSYCLRDTVNRGTPAQPSLTLGLGPDAGDCGGLAVHLAGAGLAENFDAIWQHEMPPGFYLARSVRVQTARGEIDAVTFLVDPAGPHFAGALPPADVAAILATTSGPQGSARDYLQRTARALRELGSGDAELDVLERLVAARLMPG